MDKKLLGIFALILVGILGIGLVTAYNINHSKNGHMFHPGNMTRGNWTSRNFTMPANWTRGNFTRNMSSAQNLQMQQMKNFTTAVQTAIKNNDYATWKSLMLSQFENQLTQSNFNKLVAIQNKTRSRGFAMPMMMNYIPGRNR